MRLLPCSLALVLCSAAALAQGSETKFRVEGDRLIYDTYTVPDGLKASLEATDAEALRDVLELHPDIKTLELNSGGGSLWGARKMSDIVIDYGLNTRVIGDCNSSCVRVFLAGTERRMDRGGRIGFHQNFWSADSIESYYNDEAETEGWSSPFEFASWLYRDTQSEINEALIYMVNRGVDPLFAIQSTEDQPGDMWYPYRVKLLAAGVLTH